MSPTWGPCPPHPLRTFCPSLAAEAVVLLIFTPYIYTPSNLKLSMMKQHHLYQKQSFITQASALLWLEAAEQNGDFSFQCLKFSKRLWGGFSYEDCIKNCFC
uniref:Uncharacterized protein n=1 Tax=Sphaerodactylus townsendi TaxID=933632 RepID=A0ACB8F118_9SAUR